MSDVATYRFRVAERDQVLGFSCAGDEAIPFSVSENIQVISGEKYEGEYIVTPSSETQTLETEGLVMKHNVTISPIPSNYGLITWNGSALTVS